jgi:hypothetical protein
MKKGTAYGLSPDQLARLLSMGLQRTGGQKGGGSNPTAAQVLEDILSAELPLDPSLPDSLPTVLNWPPDQVLAAAGRSMSDLLLDSSTDLAVFKTLKEYAKGLIRRGGPDAKQAAATVIYYAAIAGALVFHNQRITEHSYEKLQRAYAQLEQKPWIPSELKDLFQKARAICQQDKEKNINGA